MDDSRIKTGENIRSKDKENIRLLLKGRIDYSPKIINVYITVDTITNNKLL